MRKTVLATPETLPYLSNKERLKVYSLLIDGCHHLWSKGKLQKEKVEDILKTIAPLSKTDPYFLAHLTSYLARKSQSKDLRVIATYVSALSTADGLPFSPKSKYKKPNLRYIGSAALQTLDPKTASRVVEVAILKWGLAGVLNEAQHFPTILKTAAKKYLRYRELNLEIAKGIKKAGLAHSLRYMYRKLRVSPSPEVAAILRWQQKDKKIKFEDSLFDFKDKEDLEIAETIRNKKLPVLTAVGSLPRKITPVLAVALLEQATGDQAIILRKTFEDAGVLEDAEVKKLFEEKIKTAKVALDRVEKFAQDASVAVKEALKQTRSEKRKEAVGELGKVFLHLDTSGSVAEVFDIATKRGAIIAEMVKNPQTNFRWGTYAYDGKLLTLPEEFIEDAFAAVLFGLTAEGGTDCFALYPEARKFGADIDVHVSDGGHNVGNLDWKIRDYHEGHPKTPKPKACLIIQVPGLEMSDVLKNGYESNGIPVAVMKPEALTESALVADALRVAMVGPLETINQIMEEELLPLPEWWFSV